MWSYLVIFFPYIMLKVQRKLSPTKLNSGGSRIFQRGCQPWRGRLQIFLANFSWKLHVNEEVLGHKGARVPRAPYMRKCLTYQPITFSDHEFLFPFSDRNCPRETPYQENAYESVFLCQSTCKRCGELQLNLLHKTLTKNNQVFGENKTCALVTGDNCLLDYQYGDFIDSHHVVLRLNMHECSNHKNCGSRTTHRLLNNQYCQLRRGSGLVLQKHKQEHQRYIQQLSQRLGLHVRHDGRSSSHTVFQ